MKPQLGLEELLELCTVRIDTQEGARGTAFFVSPGFAVTCAHVVGGAIGLPVTLRGAGGAWSAQVVDSRPARSSADAGSGIRYEAPDVALVGVDDGPQVACVLLGHKRPADGALVKARGYSTSFDGQSVRAESEVFALAGDLETADPACTLLKLGHGQAVPGMSGAPVLDPRFGEVIGLLRTSRDVGSDLGAWVVPAEVIRRIWPAEVGIGNDRYHRHDSRWRLARREARRQSSGASAAGASAATQKTVIKQIKADTVTVINDGQFSAPVNIGAPVSRRKHGER
jgi:hypothetical protein